MPGPVFSLAASKLAGLGLAAKIGVAAAVTTVGVAGAGAAGVLPDRADERGREAVEAVTPPASDRPADDRRDNFGSVVSGDATGESDGAPGVDGSQIAEMAPGAAHRPVDPGQAPAQTGPPAGTGLDDETGGRATADLPAEAGGAQALPDGTRTAPDTLPAVAGAVAGDGAATHGG